MLNQSSRYGAALPASGSRAAAAVWLWLRAAGLSSEGQAGAEARRRVGAGGAAGGHEGQGGEGAADPLAEGELAGE